MAVFTGHGRDLTKTSAFAEKSSCYAHFPDEETKAHIRGFTNPRSLGWNGQHCSSKLWAWPHRKGDPRDGGVVSGVLGDLRSIGGHTLLPLPLLPESQTGEVKRLIY